MKLSLRVSELYGWGILALIGSSAGFFYQLNNLVDSAEGSLSFRSANTIRQLALGAALFLAALFALRFFLRWLLRRTTLPETDRTSFERYDALTYFPFTIFALGAFGLRFPLQITAFPLLGTVLLLQAGLFLGCLDRQSRRDVFSSHGWLAFLFFLSGFAALIYQIIWQRVLFASFGVNIESVTIVVSLFMFGLGIGSLVGGILSKWFPRHAARLFLVCEFAIGAFGLASIPLIKAVSATTLHGSLLTVSLTIYALLSLPTICMGATLPILVGYLNRHYDNVGKSVGLLYCINTFGSAVACFVAADVLFLFLGQQASTIVAASCNFLVAALVYVYIKRSKEVPRLQLQASASEENLAAPLGLGVHRKRFGLMLLLVAAIGYVALSQEILWFRAISYATGGRPDVFAHTLGFMLAGIGLGALAAKKVCETKEHLLWPFTGLVLVLAALSFYVSIPLLGRLLTLVPYFGIYACYLAVAETAALTGAVFPLACHYCIRTKGAAGLPLSWVYFANILGAVAGPLVTGFVLLDVYPLDSNILVLGMATLLLAGGVCIAGLSGRLLRWAATLGVAAVALGMLYFHAPLHAHILERLQWKDRYRPDRPYLAVVQNRSGIIAVGPGSPNVIYGGGVYDGMFSTDPVDDKNRIRRAYMIAALHPHPQEVLEIGLSGGAWARVLLHHEEVKRLVSIEINPGYLELIDRYPEIASIEHDPRFTCHIDDGRRWLERHPEERFDFILMNTTFSWRDHASNLLSVDFLNLCKRHLKPGGVIYYNTTGSEDVVFTAAQTFAHVVRYQNFVAASDDSFAASEPERRQRLLQFRRDGQPILTPTGSGTRRVLEELATADLSDKAPEFRQRTDLWLITDDNMATEYKTRSRLLFSSNRWGMVLRSLGSR